MRITSRRHVTIPSRYRKKAGFLTGTEVELILAGPGELRIVKAAVRKSSGELLVGHLYGKGNVAMTTDEIMKLMRGEQAPLKSRICIK